MYNPDTREVVYTIDGIQAVAVDDEGEPVGIQRTGDPGVIGLSDFILVDDATPIPAALTVEQVTGSRAKTPIAESMEIGQDDVARLRRHIRDLTRRVRALEQRTGTA